MLICTPHIGSWELSSLYGCSRFTMTILYRRPRMEELDSLIRSARERFGARMVAAGPQAVKALYRALASGETVGMLPDQEPRLGSGVFAPFFGIPALTMVLLGRFARKSGAGVVFAFMQRLPRGRGYRLHYLRAGEAIHDPDPAVAAGEVNRMVERCIELEPAQYMWGYRRFRRRPPGEPPIY